MSNCQNTGSPLCPWVPEPKRHHLQKCMSSSVKSLVQNMSLRMMLLLSQSVAIASAVCVQGKNNNGTSWWYRVLPLPPYVLHLNQNPLTPNRTLVHPSQATLSPWIPSGSQLIFCVGKAWLKCWRNGRGDARAYPPRLSSKQLVAPIAFNLSNLFICSSAIIPLTSWKADR